MKEHEMIGLREMIEQMTTEQLDLMLRSELGKRPIDETAVQLLMSVLEERDQDTPVEINEKIEAAWEKYQAHIPVKERPHSFLHSWPMRAVAAVAVIVLLIFAMPQNAEADGFWERLARWTDSVFEFFAPGDEPVDGEYTFKTDNPGLQQVYDTVIDLGITDPVVPMWLPDGYELLECKGSEMPSKIVVFAHFSNGQNNVALDIAVRSMESPRQYSKDEGDAESFEKEGVTYNVFRNNEWWNVVWVEDELECAIHVDCQEETLYKILESIYMMEDD